MSRPLSVQLLSEASYPAWNALLARSPGGSIYSMPEYLEVLCSVTGGRFRIVAAERGSELVGGVALYECSHRCGTYVRGRYLLYYNGFVLGTSRSKYPSEATAQQVETLAALERYVSGLGYGRLSLKSRSSLRDVRPLIDCGWRARPSYSYVVAIHDLEQAWTRVEQNLRRLVTRCTREGYTFSCSGDFTQLVAMHERNHQTKGTPLYLPRQAFLQFHRQLEDRDLCRVMEARDPNGEVVASQLTLLGCNPVAHIVVAGARPDAMRSGVTAFLRWRSFQWLSEHRFTGVDLTDAALNAVTHFKSQLGGSLELNWHLEKPDSLAFQVHDAIYRLGSRAKQSVVSLGQVKVRSLSQATN